MNSLATSAVINSGSGKYGAGITICSKHFNVFETLIDAYVVGYPQLRCQNWKYQTTLSGGASKVTNYAVFCPIDGALALSNSNADIVLDAPLFPLYFVRGFPIHRVLSLAISNADGKLIGFKLQENTLSASSVVSQCSLSRAYPQVYVSTLGNQLLNLEIDLGQTVHLDPTKALGFSELRVNLRLD